MSELNPVWKDAQIEIGVSATTADPPVWTYKKLCQGIKGIQMNFNENVVTEQYLCGEGFAHNEVTGMAPQIQITGDRVEGDQAQDFIAGLQFKLGPERVSSVKVTTGSDVITVPCVISDIVTFGGNSTELKPFNCNIRFNGKPTITSA
jgi:hypothetical protein